MKVSQWILLAFLVAVSSVSIGASTASWSYEHPKVKSGEFVIHSACMMTAEGKVSKLGVKGSEGMAKQSDEWSTNLQKLVELHLKSGGVGLLPAMSGGSRHAGSIGRRI